MDYKDIIANPNTKEMLSEEEALESATMLLLMVELNKKRRLTEKGELNKHTG